MDCIRYVLDETRNIEIRRRKTNSTRLQKVKNGQLTMYSDVQINPERLHIKLIIRPHWENEKETVNIWIDG